MSRSALLPALLGLFLAPAPGRAELVENRETEIYEFASSRRHDWHQAMMAATPIFEDGEKFAGYARWSIEWQYRYEPDGRGCRLKAVEVALDVEITLPRLRPASQSERREFADFVERLEAHEEGHYRIARRAAEAIDDHLSNLRAGDCAELARIANDRPNRILEETRERDKRYDRVTRHGDDQDAWREP